MSLKWESTNNQPRQPCKPVNNILFLKTHKTGSSTITNILNRYSDRNDLIFTFPVKPLNWFNWPMSFRLSSVEDTFGRAPNILCNHARYNRAPMNWLFPKETSRYVTILREPVQQFESVFNFFNLGLYLDGLQKVTLKLEAFLDNTTFYFNQAKGKLEKKKTLNLIKNPSLFDLGLDTNFHEDFTVVRDYIRFLEQEFDLVMLMEYFDESLVLLKRRFCWKFEDILYFKLNERGDKHVRNMNGLPRKITEQIRKWNAGDVLLYDFFNQTLWRMIKEEGPDFFSDVALFRKELKAIKSACLQEGTFLTDLIPGRGIWVQDYALRTNISKELNDTCYKMIMKEIPFLTYLREKKKIKFEAIDGSVK